MALRGQPQLDQQRAESCFQQREKYGSQYAAARQVPAHRRREGPNGQADNREERDTAGKPMRELNRRLYGWGVLNDGAVAQRPVIAATRARPRRAHHRAPKDNGDEIGQDNPGKAVQRSRWPAPDTDGYCSG